MDLLPEVNNNIGRHDHMHLTKILIHRDTEKFIIRDAEVLG